MAFGWPNSVFLISLLNDFGSLYSISINQHAEEDYWYVVMVMDHFIRNYDPLINGIMEYFIRIAGSV